MRNLLLLASLCLCSITSNARTYYVSTNGSNINPGTINAPFATWEYLSNVMQAGDTAYIRGGVYRTPYNENASVHCLIQNLHGTATNQIKIWAYPGEFPIFNLDDITPTYTDPSAMVLNNCDFIHLKGLRITGLKQNTGGNGISRGLDLQNASNCTIEFIEIDHIGGAGFCLSNNSDDNYFLNCDGHHIDDRFSSPDPWGGSNGFSCSGGVNATRNTFDGCRAWWNSDDGFDLFGTNGINTFKNCWSFWNGYEPGTFIAAGDGDGFKLGPDESYINGGSSTVHNTLLRTLTNCVAFENKQHGFNQNVGDMQYRLYNNTSYNNGATGYMWDYISPAPQQDFKNNISFLDHQDRRGSETDGSNNSWNGAVSITAADFLNITSTGADGPRQSNGSLPVLNFLHLAGSSDLVNAGQNVGLSFIGTAPDMGAYEYSNGVNQAPNANAGPDQAIFLPAVSATLTGSGSDPDGSIASYKWTKISGPASGIISSLTSAVTLVTSLIQGTYKFELIVTDNNGATDTDTVQVTVSIFVNQPPAANAGPDKNITLPTYTTALSGSGTDPDGNITAYLWTKITGPDIGWITNTTVPASAATQLAAGIYKFELKVTDDNGATDTDTMQVTVNAALNQLPIAAAGPDQSITLPANIITLMGSGIDPDGNIETYSWSKISGPATGVITNSLAATTTVTGLLQGVYLFELKVTDDNGGADTDTVRITVNAALNQAPAANAGLNQSVTLPANTITLTGSGNDPDGSIIAYAWNKIAGPAAGTITNANAAVSTVTGLVQGAYQFELTVTDNNGLTDTDVMQVTVNAALNQIPVVNAGPDQNITLPVNTALLDGSGNDPDGNITAFRWRKIAGPLSYTITSTTSASTNVTGLVQGTYQFELKATDNNGAENRDTMQVIVNVAIPVNQLPVANAGPDQSITLPNNTASLNGSAIDPDGNIVAYSWTTIAGPATGAISNISIAATTATGLTTGIYKFVLTVRDNSGATDTDTMQVTVNAAPNHLPIAEAGPNQTITLPTNTITLTGSGTDPDGNIIVFSWIKLSGPSGETIINPDAASTVVSGLAQGIYQFQLTVTDNSGGTNTDIMQVNVNAAVPPPNLAPVADAGPDQNISLPLNEVSLSGSGTDADGNITAYYWRKISGPTGSVIVTNTSASTTVTGLIQAVYKYELKVTDNNGAIDRDTMQVVVNAAPNQLPTANAGPDKNITLPINTVTLSGSGTDPDGNIITYLWTKISGPAGGTITNNAAASSSATGLIEGTYSFELKVTDDDGATDTDTMQVVVNPVPNQPPVAEAGLNQSVTLPANSITLTGSGTDPDGIISGYAWVKISGPAGEIITNPTAVLTTVTGLVQGVYQFQLTVTDNIGSTGTDIMQVNVNAAPNQAPVANAGPDQNITLPENNVSLNGGGIDTDGNITVYRWKKISGPSQFTIASTWSASTSVTNLTQGIYKFELKVTDNEGATDRDTLQVTVNPAPNESPTANAGPDKIITLPTSSVSLNGSGIDPDGNITNYGWRKISGPAGSNISNTALASTSVTGLTEGIYQFEFKVTDNDGAADTDTIQVTVNAAPNQPPTAFAGANQAITLPANNITLTGSGTDADGNIILYSWIKISGPSNGTITNTTIATTAVTGLVQGIYKFELKVTDDDGATDTDTMQVTVNAAPNQPPTSHAGSDQNITLPNSTVTLAGSGTDPDGTITAYLWRKVSGPVSGTITNTITATTAVTGLVQGIYKFELKVTDDEGATDTDTMQVTVNAAPNQPPTAFAGANQAITLPTDNITLTGSGTDADGNIILYSWIKISGPANGTITNTTTTTTAVTGLVQGIYKFELKVTDDDGATDTDTMQVTVNAAPNQPPTSHAGSDQNITLPNSIVTLAGSGTDADGTITAYLWRKISGPVSGTITNTTTATTAATGLVQGIYKFELKVTDDDGATDTDTMQVTVNAAPNQLPTSHAGSDQNITLPNSTVTLAGSGTDADGTITAYLWRKISGPVSGTITNTITATTAVTGLVQGIYKFELKVTDDDGATDTDTMQVTVNAAPNQLPTSHAGSDQNITLPNSTVTLAGSGTDPDGTITAYLWRKISGPVSGTITNTITATTAVTGLVQGIYKFELKVTDDDGATDTDTMQVTVNTAPNQLPTSHAGSDQNLTLPNSTVTLAGSGTDPDGTITAYLWRKVSGPVSGTITNTTTATTAATGLVQGVYKFELKVTDDDGATDTDTMQVTVNAVAAINRPPTAHAGLDQNITLPNNTVSFTGSGTDPDGTITAYLWRKVSGPVSNTITNSTSAVTSVTGLVEGIYYFELRVTDDDGATDTDTLQITVQVSLPTSNELPIANAGSDITIYLPVNTVAVTGTGIDPDGYIAGYSWRTISGTPYLLVHSNSATTGLSNLELGTYEVELTVTDNNGATDRDTMKITVSSGRVFNADKNMDDVIIMDNPVQNTLVAKITPGPGSRPTKLLLYDLDGRLLYKKDIGQGKIFQLEKIDMTNYLNGTYILHVYFDKSIPIIRKAIKTQ